MNIIPYKILELFLVHIVIQEYHLLFQYRARNAISLALAQSCLYSLYASLAVLSLDSALLGKGVIVLRDELAIVTPSIGQTRRRGLAYFKTLAGAKVVVIDKRRVSPTAQPKSGTEHRTAAETAPAAQRDRAAPCEVKLSLAKKGASTRTGRATRKPTR